MSIYSEQNRFRLGRDAAGNTTYMTAWFPETFNVYLMPGVEKIIPVPNNQYNTVLFTYEPGGNSILIKPDDGIAIVVPSTTPTLCIAQYNPPLKYIEGDTAIRLLSVLGAALTISFTIGAPL